MNIQITPACEKLVAKHIDQGQAAITILSKVLTWLDKKSSEHAMYCVIDDQILSGIASLVSGKIATKIRTEMRKAGIATEP